MQQQGYTNSRCISGISCIRECLNKIDLNEEEVLNVKFQPELMDSLRTQREAIKKSASLNIDAAQSCQKAAYD